MPRAAQRVADLPGVGHGTGEPVEFRYYEGVAGSDRGEGLVQAGPVPIGAGYARSR